MEINRSTITFKGKIDFRKEVYCVRMRNDYQAKLVVVVDVPEDQGWQPKVNNHPDKKLP
jgi:hypothetical protein